MSGFDVGQNVRLLPTGLPHTANRNAVTSPALLGRKREALWPEKPSLQSVRLSPFAYIADSKSMEAYSGKTRIELTPLGWLYVAKRRLRKKSNLQSEGTATALKERAEAAIRSALNAMKARRPSMPLQ